MTTIRQTFTLATVYTFKCASASAAEVTFTSYEDDGATVFDSWTLEPGQTKIWHCDRSIVDISSNGNPSYSIVPFNSAAAYAAVSGGEKQKGNYMMYEDDGNIKAAEFPTLTDASSLFYSNIHITLWDVDFPKLVTAANAFNKAQYLDTFRADMPCLTAGRYMFQYCSKLKAFESDLSSLVDGFHMFQACSSLDTFQTPMPKLVTSSYMFQGDSKLTTFSGALDALETGDFMFASTKIQSFAVNMPRLKNGTSMFDACPLVECSIGFPSLENGSGMFRNCKLEAETINAILESLPLAPADTGLGKGKIMFTGCPGAASCDPSIGTAKGWTVQI